MPLTPARLLTAWAPSALLLLPVLLAAGYLAALRLVRRRGGAWPGWRPAVFLLGDLLLLWSASGAPAVYRADPLWAGTLSVGLTSAVVPLLLALGDPVALWESARGRPVGWVRGRLARVMMFPAVGSVVAAAALTVVFTSGWFAAALTDGRAWAALQIGVLAVGMLVTVPLLSEDLLPAWCTPGLRTLLAFTDGVVDAVPGIVVMTTVDWVAGGALLAAAESVGLPMVFVVLAQWVRADEAEARESDARLDRAEHGAEGVPPESERPWWESDPRLAHRFRGRGGAGPG